MRVPVSRWRIEYAHGHHQHSEGLNMLNRRIFLHSAAAVAVLPHMAMQAASAAPTALQLTHFPTDESGFSRAPVLLSGEKEAILVDGGFTLSDGLAVAAAIAATGKKLKAIYISQSDPDYYFGLAPIVAAFPDAKVLAAPETVAAIAANVDKKLAVWGKQLQSNGPQRREDVVFAQPFTDAALVLEGHRMEIVPATGMVNRRYLWVPSLGAVVGGVLVFSGLHVWMADTPSASARQAWRENLEAMLAHQPQRVVPGHMVQGSALDASAIRFTRDYLIAFEEALAQSSSSAQLVQAMRARYPDLRGQSSLEIGAKVVMGEMAWG